MLKTTEDSNVRYATGAVRSSDAELTRYDLITPIGLAAVAAACAEGAERYGDFNWEKGMPANDLINHALRHIYMFLSGNRDDDHLGHAAWNILGAIHSLEVWPTLNEGTLRTGHCEAPTK